MDPVSDMFIRIKNGVGAGHETVQVPYSKFKHEIAKVLERGGWISAIERKGKKVRKILEVETKPKRTAALSGVKLISTPSRRLYASWKEIPKAKHGGMIIVSTSRGVMNGEEARKAKVGGQLIAEIW